MKYMIDDNGTKREMTKQEEKDFIAWQQAQAIQADVLKAEQEAKQAAKLSAIAKLAALGLTEDEAKAIIG
jgi:hypothetical protein